MPGRIPKTRVVHTTIIHTTMNEATTFGTNDTRTRYRISSEADAIAVIERLERDSRTGLYRSEIFDAKLDKMLATAAGEGKTVAYLQCDLDHFKRVNDTYGHETGHKVLRHVADVLTRFVRTTPATPPYERRHETNDGVDDMVTQATEETVEIGRVGGEEFGIALYGLNARQAYQVAERVRTALQQTPYIRDGLSVKLTMSIGVATTETATTRDDLYHGADAALYRAKHNGRNRTELFTQAAKTAVLHHSHQPAYAVA